MERRTSKYVEEKPQDPKKSRAHKNKYLYDDDKRKVGYEGIVDLTNFESINNNSPVVEEIKHTRVEKNQNSIDPVTEEKIYDINSVLEEAKKNRSATEEADKRRKLQDIEYNILNDLNQKYLSKKEKMEEDLEKEGIRELIDTITSNAIVEEPKEEVDDGKDLMSDLMATNAMTALSNEELQEEIAKEILVDDDNKSEEIDLNKTISDSGKIINSFYTRSMDLSEQDFELRDEIKEESKAKRRIIILVVLIILVLIAIVSFFVLKEINVI